jgi:hypothetical protein
MNVKRGRNDELIAEDQQQQELSQCHRHSMKKVPRCFDLEALRESYVPELDFFLDSLTLQPEQLK